MFFFHLVLRALRLGLVVFRGEWLSLVYVRVGGPCQAPNGYGFFFHLVLRALRLGPVVFRGEWLSLVDVRVGGPCQAPNGYGYGYGFFFIWY